MVRTTFVFGIAAILFFLPGHTFQKPPPSKSIRLFGIDLFPEMPQEQVMGGTDSSQAESRSAHEYVDPLTIQKPKDGKVKTSARARRELRKAPPRREETLLQETDSQRDPIASCTGERKRKKRARIVEKWYEEEGVSANGDNLITIEPIFTEATKRRVFNEIDGVGSSAVKEAIEGKFGFMRIGIRKSSDQGIYKLPLPDPMWDGIFQGLFSKAVSSGLTEMLGREGGDVRDIDPSYAVKPVQVLQSAQNGQIKWRAVDPEWHGEKLRRLIDCSRKARNRLLKLHWIQDKLGSFFPTDFKGAGILRSCKPHAKHTVAPKIVKSDRFIPPTPNKGPPIYRTKPKLDFGKMDENFEYEGVPFPVTEGTRAQRIARTVKFKHQLRKTNKFNQLDYEGLLRAVRAKNRAKLVAKQLSRETAPTD